ncbi:MAG: hypothetical protein ACRD3D_15500 [Terriglobia bacterium]
MRRVNDLAGEGLALGLLTSVSGEEPTTMRFSDDDDIHQQEGYGPEEVPYPAEPPEASGLNQWLLAITFVLIIVVVVAIGYTLHEQGAAQRLASANDKLAADLTHTQSQLEALRAKLKSLSTPQIQLPAPADEKWSEEPVTPPPAVARVRRSLAQRRTPNWQKRLQRQLTSQNHRLSGAERAVAQTQADVAGRAASTQASLSSLSDAVARSHAELVGLEEQGTRSYYEFDLKKSRKFAREGPVGLALRHTSAKHQNYDLDLMVDDFKLTRKNVDLYEPVIFETSESPQPLELVVNRIGKNEVHGYISAPRGYGQRSSASAVAAVQTTALGADASAQPAVAHPVTAAARR